MAALPGPVSYTHLQDCLHCERNGKCELQTLAAEYNVRGNIFDPVWKPVPKELSNPALVRDMTKCVRCGRCVEACQAIQTTNAIGYSAVSYTHLCCDCKNADSERASYDL